MKKYLFLLFAAAMILTACGNMADTDGDESVSSIAETTSVSAVSSSADTTSESLTVSSKEVLNTANESETTTIVSAENKETISSSAVQTETDIITTPQEIEITTEVTPETTTTAVPEEATAVETLIITVNGTPFSASFYDTHAAEEFKSMLPLSFEMSELNGNEKYIYTDTNFTTSAEAVEYISKGELLLYGDSCVVLFYDNFDTPYSYTKLGYIENTEGLENAVGTGSVTVRFSAE